MSNKAKNFNKQDTLSLIQSYGKAYFNPTVHEETKNNIISTIHQKAYPNYTTDQIKNRLLFLQKKYNSTKKSGKTWEYYDLMDNIFSSYAGNSAKVESQSSLIENDDKTVENSETDHSIESESDEYLLTQKFDDKPGKSSGEKNTLKRSCDDSEDYEYKKFKLDQAAQQKMMMDETKEKDANNYQFFKQNPQPVQNFTNKIVDFKPKSIEKSPERSFSQIQRETLNQLPLARIDEEILALNVKIAMVESVEAINVELQKIIDGQKEQNDNFAEIKTMLKSIIAGQELEHTNIENILNKISQK